MTGHRKLSSTIPSIKNIEADFTKYKKSVYRSIIVIVLDGHCKEQKEFFFNIYMHSRRFSLLNVCYCFYLCYFPFMVMINCCHFITYCNGFHFAMFPLHELCSWLLLGFRTQTIRNPISDACVLLFFTCL